MISLHSVAVCDCALLFWPPNTTGHYIFVLWFVLSFYLFPSPILSGHRLDVYHTSTHGVASVQI